MALLKEICERSNYLVIAMLRQEQVPVDEELVYHLKAMMDNFGHMLAAMTPEQLVSLQQDFPIFAGEMPDFVDYVELVCRVAVWMQEQHGIDHAAIRLIRVGTRLLHECLCKQVDE